MSQARFVLLPQNFGCLLFDRSRVQYLPFDHDATNLMMDLAARPSESASGSKSIFELIDGATDSEYRRAVLAFFQHMSRYDMFEPDGSASIEYVHIDPPTTHLAGPLVTHVEVSGVCNISCRHCFADSLPRAHDGLDAREFDCLFNELAAIGCFRVSLTGGEPLINRQLFEIIDSAISHGQHPTVTTNGMLIDEHIAREFGRRDSLRLNVSLDGASPSTNDRLRGEGVFEKVCERLKILRQHAEFTIGFTITRDSASEVEACARLARNLGASAAVFRPMYPAGVGIENQNLMPSFENYVDAIERLSGGGSVEEDISELNAECGAGRLLAAVSYQGDVNPCGFLGTEFVAGNIRDRSFRELWNDSQQFREMRAKPEGDAVTSQATGHACDHCGSADASDGFAGGCRSRSLVMSGSAHARDPWHTAHQSDPDRYFFPLKNVIVTHE